MARREWNVARNGQFRRLAKSAGVRRNPHEYAGTGAIRQEKTPTENGWGFNIGLGSIERYLKTRMVARFSIFQISFAPPSVPPFTLGSHHHPIALVG